MKKHSRAHTVRRAVHAPVNQRFSVLFALVFCAFSGGYSQNTVTVDLSKTESSCVPTTSVIFDLTEYELPDTAKLTLDVSTSWFIDPSIGYTHEFEVTEEPREMKLTLTRNSGCASGSGVVARVGGLVLIDDVMPRINPHVPPVLPEEEAFIPPTPKIALNPLRPGLGQQMWADMEYDSVELLDFNGHLLSNSQEEISRLIDQGLEAGFYLIRFKVGDQYTTQRIQLTD